MPSPLILVSIALALSLLGNAGLGKLYLGKRDELAAAKQAFDSFKAQQKVIADAAKKDADDKRAADEKAKKDADAENAATVARLTADIAKLRANPNRSRGGSVSPAPSGSKCPVDQTCFDRAEYQRAIGDFDTGARRLSDEGSSVAVDMNTTLKWAKSLGAPAH
jgi:hypothetical protein